MEIDLWGREPAQGPTPDSEELGVEAESLTPVSVIVTAGLFRRALFFFVLKYVVIRLFKRVQNIL